MAFVYISIIALIAFRVFWQYLRAAAFRIITYLKIKKICRAGKIDIKLMKKGFAFSKNKNDSFDFILKIGNTVLPVKFYSALSTRDTAYIDRRGKVCVRGIYRKPLSRTGKPAWRPVNRFYRLPSMRIRKDIISKNYKIYPVFLNEPAFKTVKVVERPGKSVDINETNLVVAGCRWLDKDTFISLIYAYAAKKEKDASGEKTAHDNKNTENT